jgi:PAS domain S-box-containing protein
MTLMSDRIFSWFYPKPTGDPGRDRNARTLQFACFLLAITTGLLALLNTIEREPQEMPLLFAMAGLLSAAAMNRAGRPVWATRIAFLSSLLLPTLLVFQAHDGFRSLRMLFFPGLLLISVMSLDTASYVVTTVMILVAVTSLGIAEKHGLTRAIPHVRSSTTYDSIFFVDLGLVVFALIGKRISRDAQRNVLDLGNIINQLSTANLLLTKSSEALRQSEGKYRRLYESITDAVLAADMAGHILETNPTFESMLGYTGEELRGLTYQDLTPERWHAFEARVIAEQVVTRGYSDVFEKEYRRRDGTVFPVELRRYLLRDEDDQPVGMWAIVRDISGRKRDEQAISEGEQRLRIAKDAARLGIYEYDVATGSILWDARVREFWGVSPDAPVTIDTFFSGLRPDDRAQTQALLERALDPGGSGEYYAEYRVISQADGSERWVAATGQVFFQNGLPVRMIGTGQDISDSKRAEEALRDSEERFRRVFEQGPLGLAIVARDYRLLKVNNALCEMLGYPEEELLRKTFADITYPEDLPADVESAERLFRREIPHYRIEKRYVKKNGEILWMNLTVSLLRDLEGQPLYGLGMVEDITEIRRAHEESLARQKLESVGTLANGIAHDFNNLLAAAEAQAELAIEELDAGSSCIDQLEAIRKLAMRGAEIVRQLMIYAGKESGDATLVDLSETVKEMLPLLEVSLSKHAIITSDLEQDLPLTRAGAAQIRQIVLNLVTNASDAIGERDGLIRVAVTRAPPETERTAVLETLPDGEYVVLEVSDTGQGMSLETRERVFDPFFTTKSAGHGLGLAVVSGIVRSLGGVIYLTSELGKGTTFQIFLPTSEDLGKAKKDVSSPESVRDPRNAAILIVEDENILREAVAGMLRKSGFEVFEAADGSSAIDFLRANGGKIDGILLDMTLPGASSQEVVAEGVKAKPEITVILTSAYSQAMFADVTNTAQIKAFIRKPYQVVDVVKALRESLVSRVRAADL